MDEQQAPPRILGAVYASEAEIELAELRRCAEKVKTGLELTDEERERVLAAMRSVAPIFEQIRRAFADMAAAIAPLLQQVARSLANVSREDYALAPPPPGHKPAARRRGVQAQHSPYGPQRRR